MSAAENLKRLGIFVTAIAVLFGAWSVRTVADGGWASLLVDVCALALGVGILHAAGRVRAGGRPGGWLRWAGAIGFGLAAAAATADGALTLLRALRSPHLAPVHVPVLANVLFASLLLAWLPLRAIVLLLRAPSAPPAAATRATRVLTGLAIAAMAAWHLQPLVLGVRPLYLQAAVGTDGLKFGGFAGWAWWQGAAAMCGLLLLGGRTAARAGALGLGVLLVVGFGLFGIEVAAATSYLPPEFVVMSLVMPLAGMYLAFWLAATLRAPSGWELEAAAAPEPAAGPVAPPSNAPADR